MSNMRKLGRRAGRPAPGRPAWLPLLLVGGGLALLAVAAFALLGRGAAGVPVEVLGAPSLSVDREKFDFGEVKLGQWVEVTVKVSNAGDQPLRFSETPYVEVVEGC